MKLSSLLPVALVAVTVRAVHISNFKAPRAPIPITNASALSSTISSRASGAAFPSGIKRGLSFTEASLTDQFNDKEVSWAYSWASSYSGSVPSGVQYIPMLWGDSAADTASWSTNANNAIAAGAEYLLAFNEPDDSAQSNLTPVQAAAAYKQYMMPFAGKAKLVSPAITNGPAPMGIAWLNSFLQECSGCQVDAIAMHIYDAATNVAYYQEYITNMTTLYGRPVWVTEFGATGTATEIQSFLGTMVSFLDNLDGVAAYAWFTDAVGNLVNSDGSLTALGNTYVSS